MICGWLSPIGKFYSCQEYGHVNLAEQLVQEYYRTEQTTVPDEYLLERQWIKLYEDGLIAGALYHRNILKRKDWAVTREQLCWLEQQALSRRQTDRLRAILRE